MSFSGTKARVASACLMAVVTLTAGVPRLLCRCPDGHLRLYCSGVCPRSAARGTCWARPPATPAPATTSCCCHAARVTTEAPAGCRVDGTGCTRLLPGPDDGAVAPERSDAPVDAPAAGVFARAEPPDLLLTAGRDGIARHAHLRSPPTDLLTTLCRLLI